MGSKKIGNEKVTFSTLFHQGLFLLLDTFIGGYLLLLSTLVFGQIVCFPRVFHVCVLDAFGLGSGSTADGGGLVGSLFCSFGNMGLV